METKLIQGGRAIRLLRWARSFDKKMNTIYAKREADNSIYRRTLRVERLDLHDKEANDLYVMQFFDWWSGNKPRIPTIYID